MQWRRGKAYLQDLRERVFVLCDAGDAVGEIAEALCVSTSYVSKALIPRLVNRNLSNPGQCSTEVNLLAQDRRPHRF